ncbi:hypothetical protein SEVIR_1G284133v4 [Setaria viridis]
MRLLDLSKKKKDGNSRNSSFHAPSQSHLATGARTPVRGDGEYGGGSGTAAGGLSSPEAKAPRRCICISILGSPSSTPISGLGGAERLMVDVACQLTAHGHNVQLFTSHHDKTRCFEENVSGPIFQNFICQDLLWSLSQRN